MPRKSWGAVAAMAVLIGVPALAVAAEEHRVEVRDDAFVEERIDVAAGDTVVWEQTGSNPHTVTADDGTFDSHEDCPPNVADCMNEGDRFAHTFTEPGEYAYHCKLHGSSGGQGMAGIVVVTEAAAPEAPADEPPATEAPPPADPAPADPAPTAADTAAAAEGERRLADTGAPTGLLALGALALALGGAAAAAGRVVRR